MKFWPWVVVGVVFLVVAGVFWGHRESVWRGRIKDTEAHASAAEAQARAVIADYKEKIRTLQPVIVQRTIRDTIVLRRVTTLPPSPAPICDSVVAVRDSVIDSLATSVVEWKDLMRQQQEAGARLLVAADSIHGVERAALHRKIDLLEHPPGSSFLGRILRPKVKPGAFAGYCLNGALCAGVGVTVTF